MPRFPILGVLALGLVGCGSQTPYRPYKGEQRPEQGVTRDPIRDKVELQYGVDHWVDEDTQYIEVTRRENRAALEHVHRNEDGTRRNAWNAYATDMNRSLGAGTVREAPKVQPKSDQMLKRSEGGGEGEGEAKPEKPADKGGEKPAEGGDKPAEGGEKKP